jgi:hypothetical protein
MSVFDVLFTQPSLGLDLFPHKITIGNRTTACCQVINSKNMAEIYPLDILVSVNGVSLFGSKELGEHESSQDHFEVAVDRIVASTLPRNIRVFRLHRYSTQVRQYDVLLCSEQSVQWILLNHPSTSNDLSSSC